jgi:formylglycine-generating enzyme required for sulfatase activity
MKKLSIVLTVLALIVITGCGSSSKEPGVTGTPSTDQSNAAPAGPAPTRIVLVTPTPKPAPPTPTQIPPTPSSQPTQVSEQSTPSQEETLPTESPEESPIPAVADIMVQVTAGPFTMGSSANDPEDAPAHEVDLPTFEIDKFEVTNADYAVFTMATGYVTFAERQGARSWRDEWAPGKDNHPVVVVTWDDAQAYCEWLGKRLPTEAEWEKAARGEDGRSFPWGDEWDPARADVKERGLRGTAAVGSFGEGASPYGVEDLVGNVWEWTADWYQPYPGNTTQDPYYGERLKVTRGGGWFDEEPQATTFNRNAADPNKTANDDLGFRCAR